MIETSPGRPHLSRNTRPRRSHVRPVGGFGAEFWDANGRRFLDCSSQTVNLLFGQCHPVIDAAVTDQLALYTFFDQDFQLDADQRAVEALSALLPSELTVFNIRMCNGSDAVESAVKQARRATGRSRVMSIDGIYLGQTTQTIHLRGLGERPADILRGSADDVVFAPKPYCEEDHDPESCPIENGEAVAELVARERDNLACVIVDPLMLSSGVVGGRAMPHFLRTVRAATRAHGVALIVDESQTFGWVPSHTVCGSWGIVPDVLVLSKGVAGSVPLSVCASTDEFDVLEWGEADYTNGGHALSVAALSAVCRLLSSPAEAERLGGLIEALEMAEAGFGPRFRTRGYGLIRGIEPLGAGGRPVNPATMRIVSDRCLNRGIYIRPYNTTLGFKPPRVMTTDQLDQALAVATEVAHEEIDRAMRVGI